MAHRHQHRPEYRASASLWEVTVIPADPTKSFDLNQPLANRRLRFWPWPFGQQETGIPLHTNVEVGDIGLAALRKAVEEELRLLDAGLPTPALSSGTLNVGSRRKISPTKPSAMRAVALKNDARER